MPKATENPTTRRHAPAGGFVPFAADAYAGECRVRAPGDPVPVTPPMPIANKPPIRRKPRPESTGRLFLRAGPFTDLWGNVSAGAMKEPETPLAIAERHVREGEERIARQERIIARITAAGGKTAAAEHLLLIFRAILDMMQEHLERLQRHSDRKEPPRATGRGRRR